MRTLTGEGGDTGRALRREPRVTPGAWSVCDCGWWEPRPVPSQSPPLVSPGPPLSLQGGRVLPGCGRRPSAGGPGAPHSNASLQGEVHSPVAENGLHPRSRCSKQMNLLLKTQRVSGVCSPLCHGRIRQARCSDLILTHNRPRFHQFFLNIETEAPSDRDLFKQTTA